MNKCIIAISGATKSKTMFQEVVENMELKIRGADCSQELQNIIWQLGWDYGQKDEKYYMFYNELFKAANFSFDFKNKYIARTIRDFEEDEDNQILAMKGSDELSGELKKEFGIVTIYIARNNDEYVDNLPKYDKVILIDDNFKQNVEKTINILLKENVKV